MLILPLLAAAALAEAPPLVERGGRYCVDVTATPGEVVVPTRTGTRFALATRSGFRAGPEVDMGEGFQCEAAATRPSGAGVIVGRGNGGLVVAVRDPGGAWSAPIALGAGEDGVTRDEIGAAVSERGDVIVAWEEHQFGEDPKRFRVARRPPGGAFGPVETIGAESPRLDSIIPGIAATGEAFVVTSSVEGTRIPVDVSIAPPGGAFGAPTRVTEAGYFTTPALDVAADGRALLAVGGPNPVIAERAPGEAFGAATPLPPTGARSVQIAARLGANGAAAVAWVGYQAAGIQVITRAAAGPFSAPVTALALPSPFPQGYDRFYSSRAYSEALFAGLVGGTSTSGENDMRIALTTDGRAVVSYSQPSLRDDLVPQVASLPLAGGPVTALAGLPPLYSQSGPTMPIVLTDGSPALLWTEGQGADPDVSSADSPYRIRLAMEHPLAQAKTPRIPRVTYGAPRERTLDNDEPLRLPVRCDSPCELTVSTALGEAGFLRLPKGGRGTLRVYAAVYVAPARPGPVRLRVVTGAPGALYPKPRTVTVRVAHAPGAGLPRPRDVRVRRLGDKLRVSFRARTSDDDLPLFVTGDDARGFDGEPLAIRRVTIRKGRERTYRVTLPAAGVRFVAVRFPVWIGPRSKVVQSVPQ